MTSLQKELEKNYFRTSFSKIKDNLLIKDLKLTNEEIIENHALIKKVLDSCQKCGDSQKFCMSVAPHFGIKRNSDKKIILKSLSCSKIRKYQSISDQEIDEQIKKLLYSPSCFFYSEEAKKIIEKLSHYENEYLNKLINNIGDPEYRIPNSFIITDKTKKEISTIYAYHMILIGENVNLLRSNELKEICTENAFNFKKNEIEKYSNKYKQICESKNLIIIDLGLEREINKHTYYADLLPNLLRQRQEGNKSTHIISPINLDLLLDEVQKLKKGSDLVSKHKLDDLKSTMNTFFSRTA